MVACAVAALVGCSAGEPEPEAAAKPQKVADAVYYHLYALAGDSVTWVSCEKTCQLCDNACQLWTATRTGDGPRVVSSIPGPPWTLVVDPDYAYYSVGTPSELHRVSLVSGQDALLATDVPFDARLAMSASHLFAGTLRIDKAGGGVVDLDAGDQLPCFSNDAFADDEGAFVSGSVGVDCLSAQQTEVFALPTSPGGSLSLVQGMTGASTLILDESYIYDTSLPVRRVPRQGGPVEVVQVTDTVGFPLPQAVDAEWMYVIGASVMSPVIGRVRKSGGRMEVLVETEAYSLTAHDTDLFYVDSPVTSPGALWRITKP